MRIRSCCALVWWVGVSTPGCAGAPPPAKGPDDERPAVSTVVSSQSAPVSERAATSSPTPLAGNAGAAAPSASPTVDDMMASSAPPKADFVPPASPDVIKLCEQMCDRMVSKHCSKVTVQACRANCGQYGPPAHCGDEIRAAFECARDADDLQCAYIVPGSCSNKFRRLVGCSRGEKVDIPPDKPAMPDGWERYTSKTAGFATPMPRGVSEKSDADGPTFSSEQGSVTYSVHLQPPPQDPPNQKNMVKLAVRMFGDTCGRKLRLHGMFEQNGQVAIHYDTECRDNSERHGMFVINSRHMYVLTVSGPKGFGAERDAFLYGFSVL